MNASVLLFHSMRQQRNRRIHGVSNFNPYNEWLGISATNPTYYQLLGVSLRETNAETIRSLAKQRIRRLKAVDVGRRRKTRDKLELRIRRAAKCLCDPAARADYDQRIKDAISHDPSQQCQETAIKVRVPAKSKKISDASPDAKPQTNARPKPDAESDAESIGKLDHANSELAVDMGSPVIPQVGTSVRGIARQLQKKRKRSNIAKFCAAMILLSIAGLAFLLAQQTGMLGRNGNYFSASNSAQKTSSAPQTSPDATKPGGHSDDQSSNNDATVGSDSGDRSNPNPTRPSETNRPGTTDRPGEAIDTATQATSSQPTNPTPQSVVPPTPDELQRLGDLLTRAKSALSNRDIALAKRLLIEAEPLARRQQDLAKFSRLETLTQYVDEYWAAANDRLKSLRGGSEVTIGTTPVMVIERTEQRLMLRVNGENKTYQTDALPLELAMALADGWLNDSAASTKVIRGAMMAVSEKFDHQAVRQLWREAEATGDVELGDFEQVLDDEYELR